MRFFKVFIQNTGVGRFFLAAEFSVLCVGLPTLIITQRLAPYMFFFLWSAAGYCFLVLYPKISGNLKVVWRWNAVTWRNMRPILVRWVICCILMVVLIKLYDPDRFFYLIFHRPLFVPILLLMYPILSALPQEFIFCTFFFERYAPFFKTDTAKMIASAAVFAYAHVLFINWIAPLLSFVAGLIFAHTYKRHRSLALVTIEHGLYGNFLFLVGLGWYFYGGGVAIATAAGGS